MQLKEATAVTALLASKAKINLFLKKKIEQERPSHILPTANKFFVYFLKKDGWAEADYGVVFFILNDIIIHNDR